MYQDKEITCRCGAVFVFTARDQEFYANGGARDGEAPRQAWEPPKRCKKCRLEKRSKFPNG